MAPYLSPCVEAFITWKADWRWGYLVYSIMNVFAWLLIVVVADETWNTRKYASSVQLEKKSKIRRLIGIEQWPSLRANGPTFAQAVARPLVAISKVPVLLAVV